MIAFTPWSDWEKLSPTLTLSQEVLTELLNGGQAFRWNKEAKTNHWLGQWEQCIVKIKLSVQNEVLWSTPKPLQHKTEASIHRYFAQSTDWEQVYNSIPWRSDLLLKKRMTQFPNLRILKQPLEETLFCFLCSSTKQIVQIKHMCELVAQKLGDELIANHFTLPTWERIHQTDETRLRLCKLGYRARYIKETAKTLHENPGLLDEIEKANYPDAKTKLMKLPGVGEKIADCVLLFGAGKLEAFPVDTWMIKSMSQHYGLKNWAPAKIAHFGRIHFGNYAGFAQQLLFSGERSKKL